MNLLHVTFVGLTAAIMASFTTAQIWRDKPIRVIVPVVAGGTPDVVARKVKPGLASLLGHPLVINNRGGAGGLIAAELAAKACRDLVLPPTRTSICIAWCSMTCIGAPGVNRFSRKRARPAAMNWRACSTRSSRA